MLRAACFCLSIAFAPGPLSGATASDQADAASKALAAAAERLNSSESARDRVTALTETVRAYEDGLAAYRAGLRDVVLRERELQAAFEIEDARLSALLAMLATAETAPERAVLLHPGGALADFRAGLLVSALTPALEARAATLKAELEELAVLRALQESAGAVLASGLEGVQTARAGLSQAIAQRDVSGSLTATDAVTLQALVSGADTLQGFAETLSSLGGGPAPGGRFATLKGTLPLPVAGRQEIAFDPRSGTDGVVIATAPRAMVTAPHAATVRYAGPLLDLGTVVILEPEAGYLLIMSGLSDVFVGAGEVLATGAPVGLMGGSAPLVEEILIESAEVGGQVLSERLYIELRHEKNTVDPDHWFDTSQGKD